MPLDVRVLPVDLLSFTAHKLYGPKGIGALYVRRGVRPALRALSFGGGQERGLRPGTLPVHQIAGFGAACEILARELAAEGARLRVLTERLWEGLRPLGGGLPERGGRAARAGYPERVLWRGGGREPRERAARTRRVHRCRL